MAGEDDPVHVGEVVTSAGTWQQTTVLLQSGHDNEYCVELQTNVREDFTITEKDHNTVFSWLKAPTYAFTFKTSG